MALEVFADDSQTTVSSGGTTAPAAGTSESWTVASSSSFPAASSSASPPTSFYVADQAGTSEKMLVTNVSGTTWTVTRGADGTTPVTHAAGFTISQVVTAGSLAALRDRVDWLNVRSLGAAGDGTTDDTTAIGNAITAASSTGRPVYFPAGTYKITSALNWKINGLVIRGDGANSTKISQATANTAVVQMAGSTQEISGLTLTYASQQATGNTSAICLSLGDDTVGSCFGSSFRNLILSNGNTGMAVNPSVATVAGVFSCTFSDIQIDSCSSYHIHLDGNNSGGLANCTGCMFSNIYCYLGTTGSAQFPVLLKNWDEIAFHQLNIEHGTVSANDVLALSNVGNLVVHDLHMEALALGVDGQALLHSSGAGTHVISGMTVKNCTFTGSASNPVANFFGTGPTQMSVTGFYEKSNTVTTPSHPFVNYGTATNITVIVTGKSNDQTTSNTTTPNSGCVSQFGVLITGDSSGAAIPVAVKPAAGITPYTTGFTSFGTGGAANLLNSSSGSDTVMVAGQWFYAALFIPYNVTLTGVIVAPGSVGGTDKWIAALWPAAGGAVLANSATAGITAPAAGASVKAKLAFTGTVNVAGPGAYIIGIQSNGTTARLRCFSNTVEGFIAGTQGGTFGTIPSLTPASTYTANVGPFASTY